MVDCVQASNGTIEGNLINGSTLGGIIITPELSWGEAGFVRNLIVKGNHITNVGYGKQSYGAIALGATAYIDKRRAFDKGRRFTLNVYPPSHPHRRPCDLDHSPYVLYGVKYIDLCCPHDSWLTSQRVSSLLSPFSFFVM